MALPRPIDAKVAVKRTSIAVRERFVDMLLLLLLLLLLPWSENCFAQRHYLRWQACLEQDKKPSFRSSDIPVRSVTRSPSSGRCFSSGGQRI